jgi:hypothetical protein
MAPVGDQSVTQIRLLGYPVRIGARQQEHLDEVAREFMLLSMSRPAVREQVPGRLLELLEALSARYATELEGPRHQREQALVEGRETIDLVYPATPGVREAITGWQSMMREVDAYCRDDELLSLATPAEVVRLQQWVVAEFLAQLDGQDPTPWTGG